MKTRKILISFALVLMLAVAMSVVAFAATGTITASSATAKRDGTVDVTVSLADNPGLVTAAITVTYDSAVLELTGVTDGGILGTQMHSATYTANPYTLYWSNPTVTADITADGLAATLHFKVKTDAAFGDTTVALSYSQASYDIINVDFGNVDFALNNGTITIVDKDPQVITAADLPAATYGDEGIKVEATADATSGLNAFTYASDNDAVATVDADGNVTIVGVGTANITVTEPGDDTYAPATVTKALTVAPKALTIKDAKVDNKVFDGTAVATLIPGTLEGVVGTDDVTADYTAATADYADVNVGEDKAVTVDGIILAGAAAANYTLTQPADVKGTITPKVIIVESVDFATGNATIKESDLVAGYTDVAVDLSEVEFAVNTDDNTKATVTNFKLNNANYVVTAAVENVDITAVKLVKVTVTAEPAAPESSVTINGNANTEVIVKDGTLLTIVASVDPTTSYKFKTFTVGGTEIAKDDPNLTVGTEEKSATYVLTATADAAATGITETAVTVTFKKNSASFYAVTFVVNGGSAVPAQTVSAYGQVIEPTAPTKDGYTFDGWYVDSALTAKYNFSNIVTGPFSLYAKWVAGGSTTPTTPGTETPTTPGEETPTTPADGKFNDVAEGYWAYEAIEFVRTNGIAKGKEEGNYKPEDTVTRAEFIAMLCRAYNIQPMEGDNFDDAGEGLWYTGYLAAAKQLGISNGVGDNKFAPEKKITREEMIQLVYNYHKSIGIDVTAEDAGFADADQISDWAKDAVNYAKKTGIINGVGDNMFAPKGDATRAQLAQIFYNMLKDAK